MTTNYTRRYLLLGGAGLAALALLRWPNEAGAEAKGPFEVTKSDEEWRKILSKEQFEILRKHGTERAGTSPLNREKRKGTFACAGCDLPLFSSETKYESGTGWPSFWQPLPNAVGTSEDRALLHGAHRSALPPLRRASRPRFPRWPEADRLALLHERRGVEVRAGGGCRPGVTRQYLPPAAET